MKTNPSPIEKIIEEFRAEFTFADFGERKFTRFRVRNYDRNAPIFHDDPVVIDLENWLRTALASLEKQAYERGIEDMKEIVLAALHSLLEEGTLKS